MKTPVTLEYSYDWYQIKTVSKKKIELDDIDTSDEYKSIGLNIMEKHPKQFINKEIFSIQNQSISESLSPGLLVNEKKREIVEKMKSYLDKLVIENEIYHFRITDEKITITIVSGNGIFYLYTINISDLSQDSLDEQIKNLERYSRLKKLLD